MWSIAWHKWCSSVVGLYWWNWKSLVHCAKRVVQFGRRIIFDKLSLFQRRAWRIRAWRLCINYQRWAENTGLKGEIILPPVPKAELVQYPLLNSWWFLLHPSPHTTKSFKLASSQLVKTEEKENALFSVPWEEPQPRSQGSLLPTLWSKRENR